MGGLGGFAKGLSKALFKPEDDQPAAPPIEIGLNEAPPEYCDGPAEANVAEADVSAAERRANEREENAQDVTARAREAVRRQDDPNIKGDPYKLGEA